MASPLDHVEAEAAGRALDRLDRLLQAARLQVVYRAAREPIDLLARHLPHLLLPRLAGALLDPRRALQEHRRRRRLGDEGEGAVGVDRDDDRDDEARLRLRLGIERLAELHDVDAALAEGRPDRRARGRLPGWDLQLDLRDDLLHARLKPSPPARSRARRGWRARRC